MTEIVVAKIIGFARAGELDPDLLCSRVLQELKAAHR
jgi:hypothetical protein